MFDPDRHEPCTTAAWDPDRANQQILSCLRDSERFFAESAWRHQGNEVAATTMYEGALGVLWAADQVAARLDRKLSMNVPALAEEIDGEYDNFERKEFMEAALPNFEASYFLGRAGSLNIRQQLNPSRFMEFQQSLLDLAKDNIENPTLEILWGGPGSIITILNNIEYLEYRQPLGQYRNEQQALIAVFNQQLQFLREQLEFADDHGCEIWRQDLYGQTPRLTGAGHGFVGNVFAFLRGGRWLSEADRDWLRQTTTNTVLKTAMKSDGLVNWPANLDVAKGEESKYLLQWCHGAPGVLLAVHDIPQGFSEELDQILIQAGETIWQAGPLRKGLGLCHGTDGNGFALLRLFQRTGDQLWLDRARAFAMHSLQQYQNKPGVWVGDSALPLYLLACQSGHSAMPLWDYV